MQAAPPREVGIYTFRDPQTTLSAGPWRPHYIAIMIKIMSHYSLPLASELSAAPQQDLSLLWMEMHSTDPR